MTSVYAAIGATDVSSRVRMVKVGPRKSTELVGNILIELDNADGALYNLFSADQVIQVYWGGVVLRNGYVLTVKPNVKGLRERTMVVVGRDYGADAAGKIINKLFPVQPVDDTIEAMLLQCTPAASEILFTSPGTAPEFLVQTAGEYLTEAIKAVLEEVNYDAWVNESKELQLFASGSVDPGITLKSVAAASDNNILHIETVEADAVEKSNYIVVNGGEVDDGWTEFNADKWTAEYSGNVLTDEVVKVETGLASLKVARGSGAAAGAKLVFPVFNLAYIDLTEVKSKPVSWAIYQEIEGLAQNIANPSIILKDTQSPQKTISYTFSQPLGRAKEKWHRLGVDVGTSVWGDGGVNIKSGGLDCWVGDQAFNGQVKELIIPSNDSNCTALFVDGLKFPVKMIAVAQDVSGLSRLLRLDRPEVRSQRILDDIASSILAKRKNSCSTVRVLANGEAGIKEGLNKWVPGYKVVLNAPGDGHNNVEMRILDVTLILADCGEQGWRFLADVTLVPKTANVDAQRLRYVNRPLRALLRSFHDRLRHKELEALQNYDWTLGLPVSISAEKIVETAGTAFPANPYNMQRFYRSDLDTWFRYSESGASWLPCDALHSSNRITDGIVIPSKLSNEYIMTDCVFSTHFDSGEGAYHLAWTAGKIYYKGTIYDISAGEVAAPSKWVGWVVGNSVLSSWSSKPAYTSTKHLLVRWFSSDGNYVELWRTQFVDGQTLLDGSLTGTEIADLTITKGKVIGTFGIKSPETPALDPNEYARSCTAPKGETQVCDWADLGGVFTYVARADVKHELAKVTIEYKCIEAGDVVDMLMKMRVMTSINGGSTWQQFGSDLSITDPVTNYTSHSFTGTLLTALNESLKVKMQCYISVTAGVGSTGTEQAYLRNFNLAQKMFRSQREDI